jgi:hypothetical protein
LKKKLSKQKLTVNEGNETTELDDVEDGSGLVVAGKTTD